MTVVFFFSGGIITQVSCRVSDMTREEVFDFVADNLDRGLIFRLHDSFTGINPALVTHFDVNEG